MSVFDFCNHFVNLYKPLEILFRVFKINLNIIKENRIDQILLSSEFTRGNNKSINKNRKIFYDELYEDIPFADTYVSGTFQTFPNKNDAIANNFLDFLIY